MRLFNLTVLLLAIAAFPAASVAKDAALALDPRAEKLLRDIEALRHLPITDERWKFENGPWADYLDRHLKESPNLAHPALILKEWKSNECAEKISSLQSDFLQRFPYLAPAHSNDHVEDYFTWTFIYEMSYLAYCRAKAELNLAFDFSTRHKARVFPFYVGSAKKHAGPWLERRSADTPHNRTRNTLCSAVEKLMHLALLYQNAPAIRDLVHYTGTPRLLVLTPEQGYALFKLASKLGLDDSQMGGLWTTSEASLDVKTRKEIDRLLKKERYTALLIKTFGSLRQCATPQIDPFLN